MLVEVRAGAEEKVDDLNTRAEISTPPPPKKRRYLAVYEISIMIDCERIVKMQIYPITCIV